MTDSATNNRPASTPLRVLLIGAGILFFVAGAILIYSVTRLLLFNASEIDISGHEQLFWALCGVVGLCLFMLGVNFFTAGRRRLTHNIVPGPTLYLLGVTLMILGMFMAMSSAWVPALILGVSGFACMSLEYRSEFI